MKLLTTPLMLLVTALCAGTASSQVTPIRFSAPVNPIAGLPKLLPSPMTGPLVGTGISLPSLVPALTPSMMLSAVAPAVAPAAMPVRLPPPRAMIPAVPAQRAGGDVVNPLRRVMPGVVVRFNAPANAPTGSALPDSQKENLDETFDGAPSKPVVDLPSRRPVTSGRHISLPEWDLERELGI